MRACGYTRGNKPSFYSEKDGALELPDHGARRRHRRGKLRTLIQKLQDSSEERVCLLY